MDREIDLSLEAFIASVIFHVNHPEGGFYWNCLNDEAKQERVHDFKQAYEAWKKDESKADELRAIPLHECKEKVKEFKQSPQNPVVRLGRIRKALDIALEYGEVDGDYHKIWVIDQIVRVLTGDDYEEWIKDACDGEDGPDTYEWDEGNAP